MVHILLTSMGNVHLYIPVMKEPVLREVQQTPMMLYGEYHNCVQLARRHHTYGYPLGFSGCEAGHVTMRLHAIPDCCTAETSRGSSLVATTELSTAN